MPPNALTAAHTSTARARIIGNLKLKKPLARESTDEVAKITKAALPKVVLPKFCKEVGKDLTATFMARAGELSCQFLPSARVIGKSLLGKTIIDYLRAQPGSKPIELLIDGEQRRLLSSLKILEELSPHCSLTEARGQTAFTSKAFPDFSLQHANCAIAESGSLVFLQATRTQAMLTFLPTTHIALLREEDLLASLEEGFARSVDKRGYWACHIVSGPSRTADIEQTLHKGAHGPKELCVIVYR